MDDAKAKAAEGFEAMKNAGFTHARKPNAKAPFVLDAFNEVWADHVNEMSRYHGAVPSLEDLRRVMNIGTYTDSAGDSISIKQLMENAFGKEAVDYFDALYREANSGAVRDKLQSKSHKPSLRYPPRKCAMLICCMTKLLKSLSGTERSMESLLQP